MSAASSASSLQLNVHQQKLAEKLIILNDRSVGLLTRVYNIKKACADSKSKPQFLNDKALESSLKSIHKKFPHVDARSGFSAVRDLRQEIAKSLALYYYTFVDLLEFKDHLHELLTTIDACALTLDIVGFISIN